MKEKRMIRTSPHLPVRNLRETFDFYRTHLGFYEEWTFGEKDGGIRRDELRLMFAEDPDFVAAINNPNHRLPLLWFVENIDGIFVEYKEKNIELADTLRTHSYGMREFAFVDINGYYIRVAEPSPDFF